MLSPLIISNHTIHSFTLQSFRAGGGDTHFYNTAKVSHADHRGRRGRGGTSARQVPPQAVVALRHTRLRAGVEPGGFCVTRPTAKTPQSIRTAGFLVPVVGLEPTPCRQERILSPSRLPFHHAGLCDMHAKHYTRPKRKIQELFLSNI